MLTIHSLYVGEYIDDTSHHSCAVVDYASIAAAQGDGSKVQGCSLLPRYTVSFQPAEDMVIPIFLCDIHYQAMKLGLQDGDVAIDHDLLDRS